MKKRLLSLVLAICVVLALMPGLSTWADAASIVDINDSSVFLKQESGQGRCTLVSVLMMFRRGALLNGNTNWDTFTEASYKNNKKFWLGGMTFYPSAEGMTASVDDGPRLAKGDYSGNKQRLISYLNGHPEGIVIYFYVKGSSAHAVLLTDYDQGSDTFYCADPAGNKPSGRIPLGTSLIKDYVSSTGNYNSNLSAQDNVLANINQTWHITSGVNYTTTTSSPVSSEKPTVEINKGPESIYYVGENVIINLNSTDYTTCVLEIYHTPTGGQTYKYWEGELYSPQHTRAFNKEGHYSCVFLLQKGNNKYESEWVGWDVVAKPIASLDKGAESTYYTGENVVISANNSNYSTCVIEIYHTPPGGSTYEYWEGEISSPQHMRAFDKEGHYSCVFIFKKGANQYESEWVGWNVVRQEKEDESVAPTASAVPVTNPDPVIDPTPSTTGVHFPRQATYTQGQFTDVPPEQWFTNNVADAFAFGLMKGKSATSFVPYGDVTVAEAITMAARIHSIYTTGSENFVASGPWYQVYLDYAYQNGIITKAYYNSDVNQKATRAQFAEIFANALPADGLSPMNSVADNAIPDVKMSASYAASVYKLYRAGILAGGNAKGTFSPGTFITRAECAAIVSRMAESNNRVAFTLT